MSLVAYDSSDGSDSESEHETNEPEALKTTPTPVLSVSVNIPKQKSNDTFGNGDTSGALEGTKKGLFSQLPAPKNAKSVLVHEEPISKNISKKETVKIRIPSLKEFEQDDEEEKERERRKPSKIGSGLMSMLPEPQNLALKETAKKLVPLSVSRKPTTVQATAKHKPPSRLPNLSESTVLPVVTMQDDHASDEETPLTDFFSLSQSTEPEVEFNENPITAQNKQEYDGTKTDLPSNVTAKTSNNEESESNSAYYSNVDYSGVSYSASVNYGTSYSQHNAYEATNAQPLEWDNATVNSDASKIKNEDFVRLAGKKRNATESIEIVDVNGDDLVAGRNEWLLKSLSETNSYQPVPKRSDQPSAVHRRKHQITYLAFQAKAREQELKNQWSMNRMTKKQTQSKYGF